MKIAIKIISFLAGCFIILVLAVASNSDWLSKASKYIPSPYRYGDLYMLSRAPGYKIAIQPKIMLPAGEKDANKTLLIIGDSYTDNFDSTLFIAGSYSFIHWNRLPDTIPPLDKDKKNVVIIESTERSVRWRLKQSNLLVTGSKMPKGKEAPETELMAETNLQYMLTHFDWQMPFQELKTHIYLNYFDKFSAMVAKPDGSGRLYLSETVDPANVNSSFNPVNDEEIKSIVENLNKINDELYALGFDEVYISIIPNAASIYKNARSYNHLIERIQEHPEAKFRFIDVYDAFREQKLPVFYPNDSHWNPVGKAIWISKVNQVISENRK